MLPQGEKNWQVWGKEETWVIAKPHKKDKK